MTNKMKRQCTEKTIQKIHKSNHCSKSHTSELLKSSKLFSNQISSSPIQTTSSLRKKCKVLLITNVVLSASYIRP